jgi:transcription initiation factor IIE alpha subunit
MTNSIGLKSVKKIMKALPGTKAELIVKTGISQRTIEMWLCRLTESSAISYTLVKDSRGRQQSKRYYEKGEAEPLNALFAR